MQPAWCVALAAVFGCTAPACTPEAPPAVHVRHHSSAPPQGVRCGTVWDPARGAIPDGRIVFDADHIASVGPARDVPPARDELDLRPLFCMPGLVDAHTHLTSYARAKGTDGMDRRRDEAARNAERTLRAGFTSVRDLGGEEGVDLWLRTRIGVGGMAGPRMQCAGSQIGADGPLGGAAGARAAVEAHAEAGFDVIKLFATGGAHDPVVLLTADEIAATRDEAHARGLRVAVHAITTEGIDRSIAAQVDSIEHASELTVEEARAMAAAGITLVPTLYILRYYIEDAGHLGFTADHVQQLQGIVDSVIVPYEQRFPAILETGVRVAMGSDSFMGLHGKNARELAYLVKAGMTPERALVAATAASAAVMGWDGKVGTLAPGAYADVVAMPGDPRKDISAVEHLTVVIKGGAVIRDDKR